MFSGRGRERHDIGRLAGEVGRNAHSAGEDSACRFLDCVSEFDSDGMDSDLGSISAGSNHLLLSGVWLCFAGYGLDGDGSFWRQGGRGISIAGRHSVYRRYHRRVDGSVDWRFDLSSDAGRNDSG